MRTLTALAALAVTAPAAAQSAQPFTQAPLIERAKLFGNPSRTQGRISPDGKWLSWIAPSEGTLNIWVAPVSNPSAARVLTDERTRPIRQHFWARNSSQIMYLNDTGGDENFRLYGVNVATGAKRALTPPGARAEIIATSDLVPNRILVGLNNRDAKWHDVHSLDVNSGALTKVFENNGFGGFTADEGLALRFASRPNAGGGEDLFRINNGKVEDKPFQSWGLDDSLTTNVLGFTTDGRTVYWIDARDRDTAALKAMDAASGATRVIGEDPRADVGGLLANPRTGVVEAYSVNYLRNRWVPVGDALKADIEYLNANAGGDWSVGSRTLDDSKWTVAVNASDKPPATFLYDRRAKRLTKLFDQRPELGGLALAKTVPVEIRSRDGLTLPSYLTLPAGSDASADGKPDQPVPMVLFVHGGPWGRDDYGFNGYNQWLANRGYAVLQVNFRASTGFGKKFISAGDQQWSKTMHDDLIDAVKWAVDGRVTTADKVAIMGGSYGGYATLAGLTYTPTTFACGVDIVGPSNLETLLSTIPPYWEAGRKQLYGRVGDPTTEAGRAVLREASPLFKADRIVRPLLIGQGANDPRVKQAESDQIVAAMRAKNIPVTYVLFPDEGHGFARPVNNIAFNAVTENFLGRCLGGRAEPVGSDVAASTAKVLAGADIVPGLTASSAATAK
jgi:dipeptidyl aminopeptidase/acylaminoacyl peptidase